MKTYRVLFVVGMVYLAFACNNASEQKEQDVAVTDSASISTDTLGKDLSLVADTASGTYICPPCECGKDSVRHETAGFCPACKMALVLEEK